MEESRIETVYDDYKFVTKRELEELGLDHLEGTNMLRAYMHGFFVDVRLYKKAKGLVEPFAFEEYRKKKIQEKIEEDRGNRVVLQKLPKVNKDLALKLMNDENEKKKKKTGDLLKDDRFKALFENPDFEVDINTEEYRLLNPVLSRLDKGRKKELEKQIENSQFEEVQEEPEGHPSSESGSDLDDDSDDDKGWVKEVQLQHRLIRQEKYQAEQKLKRAEEEASGAPRQPKFFELKSGENFKGIQQRFNKRLVNKTSLGDRLKDEDSSAIRVIEKSGNRQMTFSLRKSKDKNKNEAAMKKHREERKRLMRPAGGLKSKPNYWSK